jgi:hypothetical protein
MRAYVNDEMVMSMTKREEHYEEEDDKPPMEKAPPKEKKIREGIKSSVKRKAPNSKLQDPNKH